MKRLVWMLILAAMPLACDVGDGGTSPAASPAVNAAALSTVQAAAPAASIAAKPEPKKPIDKITSRAKPDSAKIGCNYNPSCKLNCEWCGINTCTCRLKGIP